MLKVAVSFFFGVSVPIYISYSSFTRAGNAEDDDPLQSFFTVGQELFVLDKKGRPHHLKYDNAIAEGGVAPIPQFYGPENHSLSLGR